MRLSAAWELESQPAVDQFLGSKHPRHTKRLRQAVGVLVRILMERRGWRKTGKKGSLGVRAALTSASTPGAYHNTGGLAFWFLRAERYEPVDGRRFRTVRERYQERKKPAGVFQVKNIVNGKVLLGSSLNLEGPLNGHKFMLTIGRHRNTALQREWDEYGPDKFVFETLEVVKVKDDPNFNLSDELTLLEQIWLEKLQPFDDRRYNTGPNIRQA